MDLDLIQRLVTPAQTKIVMLIMDGLGGLPREPGGRTELETARTPHLDALAERSNLGLSIPVAPGITPGSGPGHLALFGYDPIQYEIGRGAMEALGVDFELGPDDLAARGNYCTVGTDNCILDRRAGRISTEVNRHLSSLLSGIKLADAEIFIAPVKEHRFAFILRAAGLDDSLSETDPQRTGIPPYPVHAMDERSQTSASLVNQFISAAQVELRDQSPANMILLRGFAKLPVLPRFQERYGLHAAAIAVNGMYRGVARLVGMHVLPLAGASLQDEFNTLEKHWDQFDFFYIHVKQTDTCGEQGDFEGKVKVIEAVDACLPGLMALQPDVVIVGGDHSSPAVMQFHSWHPVPLLIYSQFVRPDEIAEFGEHACSRGSLGTIPATSIMPIALANAHRLEKYGA